MNCRNCNRAVSEKYCGHCGTPVALKRVDGHYISHEIQHVLHFEKGILYTIKALLLRPGQSIRAFISEDRSRLVKPVIFIILTSLAYTAVAHLFHIEREQAGPAEQAHSASAAIRAWIRGHYGYSNIIMGIFIGLWVKLIFWKSRYNFFEILIMLCFVMGMGMLIFAVFTLVEGITKTNLFLPSAIVSFLYCAWAIGQFMKGKNMPGYLLALVAYILGWQSFSLMAWLTGFLADSL